MQLAWVEWACCRCTSKLVVFVDIVILSYQGSDRESTQTELSEDPCNGPNPPNGSTDTTALRAKRRSSSWGEVASINGVSRCSSRCSWFKSYRFGCWVRGSTGSTPGGTRSLAVARGMKRDAWRCGAVLGAWMAGVRLTWESAGCSDWMAITNGLDPSCA